MRKFLLPFFLAMALTACNKPLELKSGYTEGNYKVTSIEVIKGSAALSPEDFNRVQIKLEEDLKKRLEYVDREPAVGVTVILNRIGLKNGSGAADVKIWQAAAKNEIGSFQVSYSPPSNQQFVPMGATVGDALAAGIVSGITREKSPQETNYEAAAIFGINSEIIKKLYPNPIVDMSGANK